MSLTRRALLGRTAALAVGGGLLGPALAACSTGPDRGKDPDVQTIRYGDDPSQFLELTPAEGRSRGVVLVIHGGFWQAQYDLSLGRPLARDLARRGWTAANLEYRRLGGGGGWPATFDDVRAGVEALSDVEGARGSGVVTIGHSAGGHLAVWLAGQDTSVRVRGAISQAGVLDLGTAVREGLGGGSALQLIGSPARLPETDPIAQVPLDVPVRCVHGRSDDLVPLSQSSAYVDAAQAAGADATLTQVDGDHFTVIDPASDAWRRTVELLTPLGRAG